MTDAAGHATVLIVDDHELLSYALVIALGIVDCLVAGLGAGVIAEKYTVSVATLRTQIRSILAKLGVSSQLEAVALARQRRSR